MDSKDLEAIIGSQITNAVGYLDSEVAEDRRKLMRDYMGQPMGNEIEGRSQVISSDVQDVIESVLPDLIQLFASSDQAVKFNPKSEEDEQAAEQATDYVNYIWTVDNQGFILFYDWFKDALLQKLGILKTHWDVKETTERRKYSGLSDDQFTLMQQEEGVKTVEHDEYWCDECIQAGIPKDHPLDEAQPVPGMEQNWPQIVAYGRRHKITITRKREAKKVKCSVLPPEEFLISQRATSLDDAPFLAHRTEKTQSDLIAEGFDKEQVDGLPDENSEFGNPEKVQRFTDEQQFAREEIDRATRLIAVVECYMCVDFDGDGIAELRKITVGGPHHEVLKYKDGTEANEEVAEHPFNDATPIRMPHKVIGRALGELAQDIQYVKTAVLRQLLDNMYNINNARAAVSKKVNLDDYLDNKVGSPIRVDTDNADVGAHIVPVVTAPIGNHVYPALEYMDNVRETRTGVSRLGQGLDPDALHSTASGINQLLGRSQQRTLLIAQLLAYSVGEAFKKILRCVVANQDETRTIRLRNKWTPMDPREWNTDMDVSTDVGLGRGTRDNQITTARAVVEATNLLLAQQGGKPTGPYVYAHHVHNAYAKFYEASGIKSTEPYLAALTKEDSEQIAQQMGQQQENPEVTKVKAEAELKAADMQQRGQIESMKMQGDQELAINQQMMDHIVKLRAVGQKEAADAAQLQLDTYLGNREMNLKEWKAAQDASTARMKAQQKPRAAA